MTYVENKIDRENLARDVDSDDDSEWLDDPVACGLQPLNAAARDMMGPQPSHQLQDIERPSHVSPETHDLVLKTMLGSEAWAETRKQDEQLVALRIKRLAELRLRAAAGGADGRAAALVAAHLEDIDGERLVRALSSAEPDDALVVHVHGPSAKSSAVLDAAVATLAARHAQARTGQGASGGGSNVRRISGGGSLTFARLSAVDAGVTARLDIVDEEALPALLVYRGGKLAKAQLNVSLGSASRRAEVGQDREGDREGCAPGGFWASDGKIDAHGGGGNAGGGPGAGITDAENFDQLADEVEDVLDEMGLFD